jgi:hypothetical protein
MRYSIAIFWGLCAGLLAGCYRDQNYTWHFLPLSGATPAERTANQQAEAQYSDPWPDPNLSHIDPGMRPLGYEQPRDYGPARPSSAPIIVTAPPAGTITTPYPSMPAYPATAPGSFPAASPTPYPGATPNSGIAPYGAPIPGPAPAPYVLPQ